MKARHVCIRMMGKKHPTLCIKHAGGSVMGWACIAANGTSSLVYVDHVTAGTRS